MALTVRAALATASRTRRAPRESEAARSAVVPSAQPGFLLLSRGWPLPAVLAWGIAWSAHAGMLALGVSVWLAIGAACGVGAALSMFAATRWRRLIVFAGYPVSLLGATLAGSLAAWVWLLPAVLLALVYPLRSWRDAPLFPTPAGALEGLARAAPLAPDARIADLGCGVGDGLRELRRAYPQASLSGIEWSWPLRFVCALRCRDARVSRADIWAVDWSGYDLVYLFQRPESMARTVAKATAELRRGAWLASLEFEAVGLQPQHVLEGADGRCLWLYRAPFVIRDPGALTAVR